MPRTLPALALVAILAAGCGGGEDAPPHTVTAGHTVYASAYLPTAVEKIARWRGVGPATIREVYPGVYADANGDLYGGCDTIRAAVLGDEFVAPPRTAQARGDRCYHAAA